MVMGIPYPQHSSYDYDRMIQNAREQLLTELRMIRDAQQCFQHASLLQSVAAVAAEPAAAPPSKSASHRQQSILTFATVVSQPEKNWPL